jgi:hypothetical protein
LTRSSLYSVLVRVTSRTAAEQNVHGGGRASRQERCEAWSLRRPPPRIAATVPKISGINGRLLAGMKMKIKIKIDHHVRRMIPARLLPLLLGRRGRNSDDKKRSTRYHRHCAIFLLIGPGRWNDMSQSLLFAGRMTTIAAASSQSRNASMLAATRGRVWGWGWHGSFRAWIFGHNSDPNQFPNA